MENPIRKRLQVHGNGQKDIVNGDCYLVFLIELSGRSNFTQWMQGLAGGDCRVDGFAAESA